MQVVQSSGYTYYPNDSVVYHLEYYLDTAYSPPPGQAQDGPTTFAFVQEIKNGANGATLASGTSYRTQAWAVQGNYSDELSFAAPDLASVYLKVRIGNLVYPPPGQSGPPNFHELDSDENTFWYRY
jgi:hypothetical protein